MAAFAGRERGFQRLGLDEGHDGLADGGHFFDLLAEDVIFDYIITT